MAVLTRKDGSSLHHQLFSILRTGILSGRYRVGDLLPTEEWLAENYAVSRATVRRAMQTLDARGLIERCPGIGTRVLAHAETAPPVSAGLDFGENEDMGSLATQSFEMIAAPPAIAELLGLPIGETVLRIVRLRILNGVPMRMTSHYIPSSIGERLDLDMLGQKMLVDTLAEVGIMAHSARVTIGAVIADAADADNLGVEVGVPLIDLTRQVLDISDRLVLVQHTLLPPERHKLHIDLTRDDHTKLPVMGVGPRVRIFGP